MPDLLLRGVHQAALRELAASEPVPGEPLPRRRVLELVTRLVPTDVAACVLCDCDGRVEEVVDVPAGSARHLKSVPDTQVAGAPRISHAGRDERFPVTDVLCLTVPNGPDHVSVLWLGRRARPFRDEDLSMLALLGPMMHRLLRERAVPALPASLTVQERRVLMHVAAGRCNEEIAGLMTVSTSTVRKHLEHVYRKLAVTGRQAALAALQSRDQPGLDLRERLERADLRSSPRR